MLFCYVHEALYKYCEMYGPWFRDSDPSVGQLLQFTENVFNLLKKIMFSACKLTENMILMSMTPLTKIVKFMVTGSGV